MAPGGGGGRLYLGRVAGNNDDLLGRVCVCVCVCVDSCVECLTSSVRVGPGRMHGNTKSCCTSLPSHVPAPILGMATLSNATRGQQGGELQKQG